MDNPPTQDRAFLSPYGFGIAKDATGSYTAGMLVLPAVTIVALILTVALMRKLNGGPARLAPA